MTTHELTEGQRQQLAQAAQRWIRHGIWAIGIALALFGAAIWLADWRYAGLAGLVLVAGGWLLVLGVSANRPRQQQQIARRLHERGGR